MLIHRLEQQKQLARDTNLVVAVSKWFRNDAGSKELVQLQERLRPWWREEVLGTVAHQAKARGVPKAKPAA